MHLYFSIQNIEFELIYGRFQQRNQIIKLHDDSFTELCPELTALEWEACLIYWSSEGHLLASKTRGRRRLLLMEDPGSQRADHGDMKFL